MIYIVDATEESVDKINYLNKKFLLNDVSYQYIIENNILTIILQITPAEGSGLERNTFFVPIDIDLYAGQYMYIRLIQDVHIVLNENDSEDFATFKKLIYPSIEFNYSNLYDDGYITKDGASTRFLSLYITKDKQDIYIHPFFRFHSNAVDQEGYRYIEKDIIDSDHLAMMTSSCQELKDHIDKWNLKKNTLDPNIDISKSATYLETEVDALYKIIGILLEKTKTDVPEYQPIIEAVERHNVLNIKSLNKLVAEIDEDKQNIRKQQEVYYDKAYQQ